MRSLQDIITYIFTSTRCGHDAWGSSSLYAAPLFSEIKYLVCPVINNIADVPILANNYLYSTNISMYNREQFIIPIINKHFEFGSTTFSVNTRKGIFESFSHGIIKVQAKDDYPYYMTRGAIFDKDFKPLAICYEKIEFLETGLTRILELGVKVKSSCYLNKGTPMEKFIVNKLIPEVLTLDSDMQPKLVVQPVLYQVVAPTENIVHEDIPAVIEIIKNHLDTVIVYE